VSGVVVLVAEAGGLGEVGQASSLPSLEVGRLEACPTNLRHLVGRLQGAAAQVIKRLVQQEHVGNVNVEPRELAAQLLIGVRPEAAAEQAAQVFGAQVHFHGPAAVQREGGVADGADAVADGAAALLGPLDQ